MVYKACTWFIIYIVLEDDFLWVDNESDLLLCGLEVHHSITQQPESQWVSVIPIA